MSTQTKLRLLFLLLAVAFLGALLSLRFVEAARAERLYRDVERERRASVDRLLTLKGESLASFVYDYTYWDGMVRFVRTRDRAWAAENIEASIGTFNIRVVWVLDPRFIQVFTTTDRGDDRFRQLPLSAAAARRLFGQSRFAHFFVRLPEGVMEVRGATVHPTADSGRRTPPQGYFFAGRLWTTAYLRDLSTLLQGTVRLVPATAAEPRRAEDRRRGILRVSTVLPAWDGAPLARVEVRSTFPLILELNRSATLQSVVILAFSLLVLLVPSVLIARWIGAPLRRLSTSLEAKDPAAIRELQAQPGEFGYLARVLSQFFEQSELVKEVTERRRAEEALRASEVRFQELFENASDIVFAHDLTGTVTAINRAGEAVTGFSREAIQGTNMRQLFTADSRERWQAELDRELGGQTPRPYELEIVTKEGRVVPVEVVAWVWQVGGQPMGVQGIARDITARRQTEAEIRHLNVELEQRVRDRTAQLAERERELGEAKSFLEHVIAGSPSVIFRLDPRTDAVTYVSPNVQRFLGYAREEICGIVGFWAEHVHPEDRGTFREAAAEAARKRAHQFESEYRFLTKDGAYRWLAGLARLEYDPLGRPLNIFGYALDITARKAAEEAARQARILEQSSLAKSEFLSRMSHELRTPLNAILGFAQLLEMDSLSTEQRESVAHILRGGQHLLELVNEVLDITRIESGRMTLSPEPVHVGEIVHEALGMIGPLAAQRAVRLDESPAADIYVLADLQRLKQVLLNLLSNAVKYNRPGGRVTASYEDLPGGRLRIKITDTGLGVRPERVDQLFVPFARLEADRTGVEGSGVGLAVAKGLVELMNGDIGVESAVDVGSTFWVDLPRVESPLERLHRLPEAPAREPAEAVVPAGPHAILYIEDNLTNLELLQRVLGDRAESRLLVAMQGRLGLDLARQHHPDLIVLDIHLPDLPGDEVLRRLQGDGATRMIPVIMLSADLASGQKERLLALGAYGFLSKPLDVKQFQGMLDQALQEAGARHRVGRPS